MAHESKGSSTGDLSPVWAWQENKKEAKYCNLFKNAMKRNHTMQQGSHGRFIARGERRGQRRGQKVVPGDKIHGRKRERKRKRKKERGDGQGPPFIRGCSKCAQEVLLVAAAEDVSCQDRTGQMPKC